MISSSNDKCTGCAACKNICPKNAIEMKPDEKGFLYPIIDEQKCVNCGLCEKACHLLLNNNRTEKMEVKSYVAKNEKQVRAQSSSGGMFSALADTVLSQNGSVYGACFDDNLSIIHDRAYNKEQAKKFQGSKYVQSELGDIYQKVVLDLSDGRYVLFTGTPCQVSGLLAYADLKKVNTEKLYTQDFVCHGVGSPAFYKKYLESYEKKYHSKAVAFNFRGKPKKGKFQNIIIDFENGKKFVAVSTNQDTFYYHFLNNLILRPSCYSCKYAKEDRVSDITVADCFKIENGLEKFDDRLGLSFIMVNTAKGRELFNKIDSKIECIEVDKGKYIQPNMKNPTPKPSNYNAFWNEYNKNGYLSAIKKYGNDNLKDNIKKGIIYSINILGLDELIKKYVKK